MEINSENIKNYIINNLDLEDENNIQLEDIYKLKEININRLNYKLKEAVFIPEELSYLKELEKCSFSGFLINDDIKENLEKLDKLGFLKFDHCTITGYRMIKNKIKDINLNYSNFNLLCMCDNKTTMETIWLKNVIDVDVDKICDFENVKEIALLNCEVHNSLKLTNLKNLKKIRIIGSKLDNKEIIKILNKSVEVNYSEDEYFNIG